MSNPELSGTPGELRFTLTVTRPDGTIRHQADFVGAATPEQARALSETLVSPQPTQESSNGSNPLDSST